MDLSKVYDSLTHNLLIAKLEAYGLDIWFSLPSLSTYLCNCKQRTNVGFSYSDWFKCISGIPQNSILGLFHFNIFFNMLLRCEESFNLSSKLTL